MILSSFIPHGPLYKYNVDNVIIIIISVYGRAIIFPEAVSAHAFAHSLNVARKKKVRLFLYYKIECLANARGLNSL